MSTYIVTEYDGTESTVVGTLDSMFHDSTGGCFVFFIMESGEEIGYKAKSVYRINI